MNPEYSELVALGLVQYVVFLLSTTCHEASHALAAKIGGDPTASLGGQVTLNPTPHVMREPFGMVVVPLLSLISGNGLIGWASAPFDPLWQMRFPKRAAWMSLAGPAANFTLMLLAALLIHAGIFAGVFRVPEYLSSFHLVDAAAPGAMEGVAKFISILFSLNLLLGMFNLLPVPPLDGFAALGLFMTEPMAVRFNEWGHQIRAYSFIGLLIGWQVFGQIYWPIFRFATHLLYPGYSMG